MGEPDPSAGEPHEVLGVDPDTPPGEIRIAAAKAKRTYNPDAYPPAEKRDAREAFYAVVAAERALLGGVSAYPSDDPLHAAGLDRPATAETDGPSLDADSGSADSSLGRAPESADTPAATPRVDQPTLSFPDSERRRFHPDGGVTCRVVGAASGDPRSGYRIYAEQVDGDERIDAEPDGATDSGTDTVLPLSPGRWRICAEHADENDSPTLAGDLTATQTVDSTTTQTVDSVAVTVVREPAGDDTPTARHRLDGRTRVGLSLLAAVVAVAGTAGVVLTAYLDGLSTASALVSGVVAVAGVVSYRRVIR